MIGQTFGHYRVLEQIGAGGMGLVFRAHDERLDRDVALKVLPPGTLTDENAHRRFRKEALTLSQLNHPNIETVHDFDTQGEVDFLVMELIPGLTLDEKLMAGALPEREVIRLGAQLAEGLAAAHAEGIVHRDLKPGNLRITPDGRLKILDFGLATLLRPVSGVTATESLSKTHGVVGTLPYMAPEQLRGEAADARSDLWAAGAVLYELATGRRPFAGSGVLLIDAILNQAPPAPCALNPQVSPALEAVILKALEKDPDQRYYSARELLVNLQRTSTGTTTVAAGVAPANRGSRSRALGMLISIVVIVACLIAGWRVYLERTAVRVESIAVLPLLNGSGDPNMEYFSDGITESLIDKLSEIPRLRVMAPATIFAYKGRQVDPREVGRTLRVASVLQGKVTKIGDTLRIKVDLVDAAEGTEIWGEEYNPKTADILAIQAEISREIAVQLRLRLSGEEQKRLARRATENSEAYQLYLQGRYHVEKYTLEGIQAGMAHFQKAIDLDPHYALAYSGLAYAYWTTTDFFLPPRESMPRMSEAASKALALDDTLPEAHMEMGIAHFVYELDRRTAEKELRRAIELRPNYATAHAYYGWYLVSAERFDEGIAESRRAVELDPLSVETGALAGQNYYFAHRYDLAVGQLRKTLEMDSSSWFAHFLLGMAYEAKGDYTRAIPEMERARSLEPSIPWALSVLGHGYAAAGRNRDATLVLRELEVWSERSYVPAYNFAEVYVGLGEREKTLAALEKAYDERSMTMTLITTDPRFNVLRSEPRFTDLLRRVSLELAKATAPITPELPANRK